VEGKVEGDEPGAATGAGGGAGAGAAGDTSDAESVVERPAFAPGAPTTPAPAGVRLVNSTQQGLVTSRGVLVRVTGDRIQSSGIDVEGLEKACVVWSRAASPEQHVPLTLPYVGACGFLSVTRLCSAPMTTASSPPSIGPLKLR